MPERHKTTIRIDQEVWRAFIADLRSKHLRSCSVLEALISAYLYGGAIIPGLGRPQTVQLTIQRIINVPPGREPEPVVPPGLFPHMAEWSYNREMMSLVKVAPPHK